MSENQVISSYKTIVRCTEDNRIEVVFHKTTVVKVDEKEILLDTGDWWTRTTKSRMNQASQQFNLEYRVFAKKDTWYVEYQGKQHEFAESPIRLNRANGEVISQN